MSYPSTMQTPESRPQPIVGGWLYVLCLLLVFIWPGEMLYSVLWKVFPKLIAWNNVERLLLGAAYCAIFTSMAGFSFWTGIRLWLAKPDADKLAKNFFLSFLGANLGYFLLWAITLRPHTVASYAEMGWYHAVTPIASTVFWYFYLENSARVRDTYSPCES
jgi:hypothetical protein